MKQSPKLDTIQANMMPGALSAHGFLGEDSRKLNDILAADAELLKEIGVTQKDLADRMQELTDYGAKGLGSPIKVSERFEVEVKEYRGKLACPFKDNVSVNKRLTQVKRLDSGDTMCWTDLNIHMIYEHGFFEGYGSTYRLEPKELVRFLKIV